MKLELNVVRFEANDIMTASGDVVTVSYYGNYPLGHYHIVSDSELPTSVELNGVEYTVQGCSAYGHGAYDTIRNGGQVVGATAGLAGTYVYTNGVWEKQ